MKIFILALTLSLTAAGALAETLHPTFPGTNIRDYSKPSIVYERGRVYETFPGTDTQDYSKPTYIIQHRPRRQFENPYSMIKEDE